MHGSNPEDITVKQGGPEVLKERKYGKYYMWYFCLISFTICIITSFGPDPIGVYVPASDLENGCDGNIGHCICPREAVCAESVQEIVYLAIARTCIYAVYPFIMLLFLSKANHLITMLQGSVFSVWIDFSDYHHLHVVGGRMVEFATWVHVFFHCLRWALRNEMDLLVNHVTGLTGLVATVVMPFITWPMVSKYLHKRLSFEYRKSLHYLSWVWGLSLVFHAPAVNIFYIMGSVMLIYFLNYFLGLYFKTFLIPSPIFRQLDTGVSLSFYNPRGFELVGASYVVVMLPWISTTEWHAFSIFPHPTEEDHSSICISAVGDWSKKLHATITRPTVRPVWVSGPFLSPFSTAHGYDNIITLATGIGITPALAVLNMFKETRRVNLVWMCRDPSLIEYFVSAVPFPEDSFVLIYYTGKKKLLLDENVPANVFLFKGRPILDSVITGMVHRIESKLGLPEEIVDEGKSFRVMPPSERFLIVLSRILAMNSPTDFFDLCVDASMTNKRNKEMMGSTRALENQAKLRASRRYMMKTSINKSSIRFSKREITKEGLMTGLNEYIGRHEFSLEDIDHIFKKYDKDGDEILNESEFTKILVALDCDDASSNSSNSLDSDFEAYQSNSIERNEVAGEKVSNNRRGSIFVQQAKEEFSPKPGSHGYHAEAIDFIINNQSVLKTWQMLYCGGSAPVVANLKDISNKYNIDLQIEKFDW